MVARVFLNLTEVSRFRRLIWKPVYEILAKKIRIEDWHFMNYGYVPSPNELPLSLHKTDEINRYPLQLYHYHGYIN
jgi:hypothetical protein